MDNPLDELKSFTDQIDLAQRNFTFELERLIIEAIKDAAQRHPKVEFTFVNAMGTWGFDADDEDIELQPITDILAAVETNYSYQVLPWVYIRAKGKEFEIKHDW